MSAIFHILSPPMNGAIFTHKADIPGFAVDCKPNICDPETALKVAAAGAIIKANEAMAKGVKLEILPSLSPYASTHERGGCKNSLKAEISDCLEKIYGQISVKKGECGQSGSPHPGNSAHRALFETQ